MNFVCALTVIAAVSFSGAFCQPMSNERLETPPLSEKDDETVVAFKYEAGMLQEVRVAHNNPHPPTTPKTSFDDRQRRCADLCRAGFGGQPCGQFCSNLMPSKFLELIIDATKNKSTEDTSATNGVPRYEVCKVLCDNSLGQPMCGCKKPENTTAVKWDAVCETFCQNGFYRLKGCPECSENNFKSNIALMDNSNNYNSNQDVWVQWCNYQCRNGDGGAACNCDLAPLMA